MPEKIRHLLRAEGSDWFWWFGDDHVTAQADIFDRLFRRHLEALYRTAGLPVPPHLQQFIKQPAREAPVREPAALFTPCIDGRIGDYFEWLAAGYADLSPGGAMHAAHHEFSVLLYGYDRSHFYLRLDPEEDLPSLAAPDGRLEFRLHCRRPGVDGAPAAGGRHPDPAPAGRKRAWLPKGRRPAAGSSRSPFPWLPLQLPAGGRLARLRPPAARRQRDRPLARRRPGRALPYRGEALEDGGVVLV